MLSLSNSINSFISRHDFYHYCFDRSGAGSVMEFMNGQVQVYDNNVGVLENNLPFPYYL